MPGANAHFSRMDANAGEFCLRHQSCARCWPRHIFHGWTVVTRCIAAGEFCLRHQSCARWQRWAAPLHPRGPGRAANPRYSIATSGLRSIASSQQSWRKQIVLSRSLLVLQAPGGLQQSYCLGFPPRKAGGFCLRHQACARWQLWAACPAPGGGDARPTSATSGPHPMT